MHTFKYVSLVYTKTSYTTTPQLRKSAVLVLLIIKYQDGQGIMIMMHM
jgi:hypothetical protein